MVEWLIFAGIMAVFGVIGLAMWDDIGDWYAKAQQEALRDELWESDDDLAESA